MSGTNGGEGVQIEAKYGLPLDAGERLRGLDECCAIRISRSLVELAQYTCWYASRKAYRSLALGLGELEQPLYSYGVILIDVIIFTNGRLGSRNAGSTE